MVFLLHLVVFLYLGSSVITQDIQGSGEVDVALVKEDVAVHSRRSEAVKDDESHSESKTPYWIRAFWNEAQTCQASALVDILAYYNWTYVNIVTSSLTGSGEFMHMLYDRAIKLFQAKSICVSSITRVPEDATAVVFKQVISTIETHNKARVVILFLTKEDIRKWISAVHSLGSGSKNWVWLATDEWGNMPWDGDVSDTIVNAISLHFKTDYTREAKSNLLEYLALGKGKKKPWYQSLWESTHDCKFNATGCTGKEENVPLKDTWKETSDGRFAEAYVFQALDKHIKKLCEQEGEPDRKSCLRAMDDRPIGGAQFYNKYFEGTINKDSECGLKHTSGEGNIGYYEILQYQGHGQGRNGYVAIGSWATDLDLREQAKFTGSNSSVPVSVCSTPCGENEEKMISGFDSCCWVCVAKGHGEQTRVTLSYRSNFLGVIKVIWMWLLAVVLTMVLVLVVIGLKCWSFIEKPPPKKKSKVIV